MNLADIFDNEKEMPLDNIVADGGYCGIFRTICCIGDSLSSGEMESKQTPESGNGYHDYFEYSWGQFMARDIGAEVLNFSRGGMTAKEYCDSFAKINNMWSPKKAAQAYIIALGVNDISVNGKNLGSPADIDLKNRKNNKDSFVGYYAQIIQRIKEIQPKARVFLMTIPRSGNTEREEAENIHRELLYELAEIFEYTYVLDFRKYAPIYDEAFKEKFFLGGHMSAAGYRLTAKMTESYIDYIIRHNMDDFAQIAFVGTEFYNCTKKW